MVDLPILPLIEFTILNLFDLPSHVTIFNVCNEILTGELLQQGDRYHNLRKLFFQHFIAYTMNWFLNSRSD